MATQGERLAALERGLSDHEERCEERLVEIKALVGRTDSNVDKLSGLVVGLIVSVAGTAVITLVGIVLYALKLVG